MQFEWDDKKDLENQLKHNISFNSATSAFTDELNIITKDELHSIEEQRYICYGKINGEVATVRFTYRDGKIRIIGAAYWRKGKKIYGKKNYL